MFNVVSDIFDFIIECFKTMIIVIYQLPFDVIQSLLERLGVSPIIENIFDVYNTYVLPNVGFFADFIPPITWEVITFYFGFIIGLYAVVFTLHYSIKIVKTIKKIVPMA